MNVQFRVRQLRPACGPDAFPTLFYKRVEDRAHNWGNSRQLVKDYAVSLLYGTGCQPVGLSSHFARAIQQLFAAAYIQTGETRFYPALRQDWIEPAFDKVRRRIPEPRVRR